MKGVGNALRARPEVDVRSADAIVYLSDSTVGPLCDAGASGKGILADHLGLQMCDQPSMCDVRFGSDEFVNEVPNGSVACP
jgi:hypothetical protein